MFLMVRTDRVSRLDRRQRADAEQRRRDERRPDPMERRLLAFDRLEALPAPPAPLPPPGPTRGPTTVSPRRAAPAHAPSRSAPAWVAPLTAPRSVFEPRRRSLAGRAVVLSAVGSLGVGAIGVLPAAASPLPQAPPGALAAPVLASAFTGLEQGSRGEPVRQLQQALIDAGVPVGGGADGIFGPQTRASVERFQSAQGLPVSGRVDQATAEALASQSSAGDDAPQPASTTQDGYVGLARGATGPLVEDLQRALVDMGVWLPRIDGNFDASTERGLRQFQTWNQIGVTGTVTQAAAKRLRLGTSSAPPAPTGDDAPSDAPTSGYVGLARGARGPLVADLQRALIDRGIAVVGGADGVFGPKTEEALARFQQSAGRSGFGEVTSADVEALGLGGSSQPAPEPEPESEPQPAPDASPHVGLNRGDRGPLVADVQRALIERGITVGGGADGVFGPMTQAALVEFQRANGLSPTGVVSAADVNALGLAGDEPAAPPATDVFIGLSTGSRGAAVRELQKALIEAGVTVGGGADGVFGPKTEQALRSYQSAQGLGESGVVDAETVQRLGLGSADGPQPFNPPPAEAADPPPTSSGNPYVGLALGARGPLVTELQQAIQRTGLVIRGGADGIFGPSTDSALKAFQGFNGIPQTGVVTERGARIMALGTDFGDAGSGGGSFQMERFPVQGRCFFGDTWHAPRGGGRLHVGTDIIAAEGKLLYAVVDGTISRLYWDQPGALSGNGLRIAQPNGTWFTYLHMQGFAPGIEVGTKVQAGDVIGWVGNTGSSATPHLHFEIHPLGGAAINPYPYLKAMDDCENDTPQYQSSFAPNE